MISQAAQLLMVDIAVLNHVANGQNNTGFITELVALVVCGNPVRLAHET